MQILICDDSKVARRSMARCISESFSGEILFAEHGIEALSVLESTSIDILFLDLTMPEMDGFEVLAEVKKRGIKTQIVVVSGDIQAIAQQRCYDLGAYAFVEKPLKQEVAKPLFHDLGIPYYLEDEAPKEMPTAGTLFERFQEVSNVALGVGAATIAEQLKEFIVLPVPQVGDLSFGELTMMILDTVSRPDSCAVAQRFVGGGLHGEALVCIEGNAIQQVGERLGYAPGAISNDEVVVNLVNVLVSSFLVSLSEQIGLDFSLREPLRIENFNPNDSMLSENEHIFTVEYTYNAESIDLDCSVLFMFDQTSVAIIEGQLEMLQ
ncbi:response regulator [Vibrio hippocampi]|uniref:Protein-glutamate methylesterase/protein-glutamine glutaminase n=1 Tax=Vibrio hippocampi TaxID=654686 RepID=A0ABN8DL93_9VIBR|nr:response regulator [Vibrio hippocampi]CAH0526144.1 Protein-glutamate methylesterase/protein-glutamine glutaminase [Vibrio hippocampi]